MGVSHAIRHQITYNAFHSAQIYAYLLSDHVSFGTVMGVRVLDVRRLYYCESAYRGLL